jgi:hypothetical protein
MFRDPLFKNKTMSLHMNWNSEKTSKKLFLEQLGDWHVSDTCLRSSKDEGGANTVDAAAPEPATLQFCCVDHPAAICHYRDLPSVHGCDSSPALKGSAIGLMGW